MKELENLKQINSILQNNDVLKTDEGYYYDIIDNRKVGKENKNYTKQFKLRVGREKFWYLGFILKYGNKIFRSINNDDELIVIAKKIEGKWYILDENIK